MIRRTSLSLLALVCGLATLAGAPAAQADDAAQAVETGIAGRVVAEDTGAPLAGIEVRRWELVDGEWDWWEGTVTDDDGRYELDLSAGTYRVEYRDPSDDGDRAWRSEFHADAPDVGSADDVVVGDGVTTLPETALTRRGSVTGTVTSEAGIPIPNVAVRLCFPSDEQASGYDYTATETDSQGRYRIYADPGTYRVQYLDDFAFTYASEFLTDAATFADGEDVVVGAGVTTGVDAELVNEVDEPGEIRGTVTSTEMPGGEPVPIRNVRVTAYERGATDWQAVRTVSTDRDGGYVLSLTEGRYRLEFDGRRVGHEVEFHDDATDLALATELALAGGRTIGPIDAALDPAEPSVVNIEDPEVVGTAEVGEQLRVNVGAWDQPVTGYAYQWYADDREIPNATGPTFEPRTEHRDAYLDVLVTASATGFVDGDARTAKVGPVVERLRTTVSPEISGAARVGETLTATDGTWGPVDPEQVDHAWFADGTRVRNADGDTLQLGTAQRGKSIHVEVTASAEGLEPGTDRSTSFGPVSRPVTNTTAPSISGDTRVGATLTANTGTWDQAASFFYQWFADNREIADATGSTWVVTAAHRSRSIHVEVTARPTSGDYDPGTARSASVGPVVQPVDNTVLPTIGGTPRVGETLTASTGSWDPRPQSYTYAWFADGVEIDGATTSTLRLTGNQRGKQISVEVVVSAAGYEDGAARSEPTAIVTEPVANTTPPTVSGDARVGSTLTASTGAWSPRPSGHGYAWYADDALIADATGSTLRLAPAHRGKRIHVVVTAAPPTSPAGWTAGTARSASTAVVTQQLEATTAPRVTGDARVGGTLTATDGTWPVDRPTYRYAWYAGDSLIAGATERTLNLTTAQRGTQVRVVVTATPSASEPSWTAGTASSATTGIVTQPLENLELPDVTGDARVGETLSTSDGRWSPAPSDHRYAWYADDALIPGATGNSLRLAPAQRGKRIHVVVTAVPPASPAGWIAGSARSAATAAVTQTITSTTAPRVTGDPWVGETLTAQPGSWSVDGARYAYQWYADGAPIAGATSATLSLTEALRGARVGVLVTASADGYLDGEATSAEVGPVADRPAPPTNTAAPTVTGTARLGQTLTARPGTWSVAGATYAYQWLANGTPIAGAISASFKPAAGQLGRTLSVRVTATAGGVTSTPAVSRATAKLTATPAMTFSSARAGKKLKVTVTVKVPGVAAVPGKVTVLQGRKRLGTITLRGGKGTLLVKRPARPTTLTARYAGSGSILAATRTTRSR